MVTFEIAASCVNSQPTRSTARTATRWLVKNADVSVTTSVPCRSATTMRFFGTAQMMLSAMAGEVSSGTPATTRDAGAVGSLARSALLLPAVLYSFSVAMVTAVAGEHTTASTVVFACSALDLACSAQSKSPKASPAVDVMDSSPAGPFDVVFAKNAKPALRARSRTQAITDDLQRGGR